MVCKSARASSSSRMFMAEWLSQLSFRGGVEERMRMQIRNAHVQTYICIISVVGGIRDKNQMQTDAFCRKCSFVPTKPIVQMRWHFVSICCVREFLFFIHSLHLIWISDGNNDDHLRARAKSGRFIRTCCARVCVCFCLNTSHGHIITLALLMALYLGTIVRRCIENYESKRTRHYGCCLLLRIGCNA